MPLDALLQQKVLDPMGLTGTDATQTAEIPAPVLHAYSSERRAALGIPPTEAFYEESTFWNAQWGTPIGANQTTTIDDMATTAVAVGSGSLLSQPSYEAMTAPNLLGFGHKEAVCAPSCFTQIPIYNLRSRRRPLRIVAPAEPAARRLQRDGGLPTVGAGRHRRGGDLPARAFDNQGNYPNASDTMFRAIGALVAPKDPPPPL